MASTPLDLSPTDPALTGADAVDAAPPRRDRVPLAAKIAYATGGTTDIFGHWLYNTLAGPVFNVYLGLSPTQVSLALGFTRFVDAFTDPLFGWLSDNTRSRWGRRRPWILAGSLLAGLGLPCLFLASASWSNSAIFWFMLLSATVYAPLISAYNMPYQSLGSELTPDYDERTSVMSWKAIVQKLSGMLIGAALWFSTRPMWNDPLTGRPDVARGAAWAAAVAGGMMVVSGLANFLFVKERYYGRAKAQAKVGFFAMFRDSFRSRPYLVLLATAFVYAVPSGLLGSLGFYVTTYHVFGGDMAASAGVTFWASACYAVFGIVGVPTASALAKRFGKRAALTATLAAGLVAFGSSWWMYTPEAPWLSAISNGLVGFSATGLWVVLPSMCVDVVDHDELHSGQRREGAFASTFSWVLKVGMSASLLLVGPLLDRLTGFDAALGHQSAETLFAIRAYFAGIPVVSLLVCLGLVQLYPLTRERMTAIRAELEARRGAV